MGRKKDPRGKAHGLENNVEITVKVKFAPRKVTVRKNKTNYGGIEVEF